MQNLQHWTDYLNAHDLQVVTAESCTAGLVAAKLGAIPGCGDWLDCSYVTYSPQAKNRILGVRFDTIERCNLTSEAVAREMAEGALQASPANVAISNTGVAGPGPGEGGIPVGTVCFGWAFRHDGQVRVFTETRHFDGDRNAVREAAADHAIARIPALHAQLLAGQPERGGAA
jgi:PncC family amidohydrolase